MSEDAKKYEDQQQRNMVAMMEMQDTINHLQRELSALGMCSRFYMTFTRWLWPTYNNFDEKWLRNMMAYNNGDAI